MGPGPLEKDISIVLDHEADESMGAATVIPESFAIVCVSWSDLGESFRRTINSSPLDDWASRCLVNGSISFSDSISPSDCDFNHSSDGAIYPFVGTKSGALHYHRLSEISVDKLSPNIASEGSWPR